MDALLIIIALAVIVEAVIQVIKGIVTGTVPAWVWPAVGVLLGVVLCVTAKVDMLAMVGITLGLPYLGSALTGVIISRGASFVHDVWGKINGEGTPNVDVHTEGFAVDDGGEPPDGE